MLVDMAIELFGLTISGIAANATQTPTPINIGGLTISDLAAIVALIASPLIFLVSYNRTRKSEQIKIAREFTDRIDAKRQKLFGIRLSDTKVSEAKASEVLRVIADLLLDLEYFWALLKIHEIRDENILKVCIPRFDSTFGLMDEYLDQLRTLGTDKSPPPNLDNY